MPLYLHQWTYKTQQISAIVEQRQDRAEIVRVATEVFGGKLHEMFFSFGDFDGLVISEFKDNETALACLLTILGQGNVQTIRTTPLITPKEFHHAMNLAHDQLK